MKTLSLSEAKMKLSRLVDEVLGHDEQILITKNGKPAAALISADEFDSIAETLAIKSDAELMGDVRRGLKNLNKKSAKLYSLGELLDQAQTRP